MTWSSVKLAEVATIDRDAINASDIPSGTQYLGLEHIEAGGRILGAKKVESDQLASTKFRFDRNHILYGKLRPYLAKIALPSFSGICSTDILPIRPGPRIDRAFLAYFLRQPSMVEFAASRASGANLPRLSPTALADFDVPIPPLAEQKRIAAILDQADSLRRLRQCTIDRLNSLGQAIFWEMFGDPQANPKGYPIRSLGELGEIRLGKMLDRGKDRGTKALIYLRNANVQWFRFDLDDVLKMDFWENELDRYRVLPGDLLICEGGQPGRCAIWKDESTEIYYQKALHRARFRDDVARPEYVAYWLHQATRLGIIVDSVSSATIAHLTGEKLKLLQIMLPPISEQRTFASKLKELDNELEAMRAGERAISRLFRSLQDRAFHGEL